MSGKILVVEDNPQSMALVQLTLRHYGYTMAGAPDGETALDLAAADPPDLVIMDIHLPGIDGVETARRLRQMPGLGQIIVLAMTAYAMKGDEERLLASGFDAYLSKPINTRELPGVIARLLEKKDQHG